MAQGSIVRASVTNQAGGLNFCTDGNTVNGTGYIVTGGTLTLTPPDPSPDSTIPSDTPIGENTQGQESLAQVVFSGAGSPSIDIPDYNLVPATTYTVSAYVYIEGGGTPVALATDTIVGNPSTTQGAWERISLTFTATAASPDQVVRFLPAALPEGGETLYFTGVMIQPGATLLADLPVYTDGGGQPGDDVQILVDGADTPITAAGLAGYLPEPGDRLLVQRVGSLVEVIQYLSRGTVPYIAPADLSAIQIEVDGNTQALSDQDIRITGVANTASAAQANLDEYAANTDATLGTLQGAYSVLTGFGEAGVEEDYIWVGDDPVFSTVKKVQISTYVQAALYAGDAATWADYFGLWTKDDIGDVEFTEDIAPPMTEFYNVFTTHGLLALPWNA